MRCGDKLVVKGDSMAGVRALCGPPATVQQGVKESSTTSGGHASNNTVSVAVPAEVWTYNRGPDQMLVDIRFVNGHVVAIETLHQRGY
jgi:hypothetical protein